MAKRDTTTRLDFWDSLRDLFSNPGLFFEKLKSEPGIKKSLLTFAIVSAFFTALQFIFNAGMMGVLSRMLPWGGIVYPTMAFVSFGISILATFVYSGLIQVVMIAFKSGGTYKDSYNVFTYSMIPYQIFNVIPYVGSLSIIYSFILMIMGISKVHNVSKGKAGLACLLPAIVAIAIVVAIIIWVYMWIFRNM